MSELTEKRFTFRAYGWLLEKLLKETNCSEVIRKALTLYYRRNAK